MSWMICVGRYVIVEKKITMTRKFEYSGVIWTAGIIDSGVEMMRVFAYEQPTGEGGKGILRQIISKRVLSPSLAMQRAGSRGLMTSGETLRLFSGVEGRDAKEK
jgi:hypothetical protein